ncbi:MAG: hypothetical protein KGL42_01345 [Betaproteobacteria bacterium]|nr:hypothetical protein [Betaproteobacteria bacterium]
MASENPSVMGPGRHEATYLFTFNDLRESAIMTIWNNSKMSTVYYADDSASESDPCVIKITDREILVEYDDDGLVQYRGTNGGSGHFMLSAGGSAAGQEVGAFARELYDPAETGRLSLTCRDTDFRKRSTQRGEPWQPAAPPSKEASAPSKIDDSSNAAPVKAAHGEAQTRRAQGPSVARSKATSLCSKLAEAIWERSMSPALTALA